MVQTTPTPGGMSAFRLPAFLEHLSHANTSLSVGPSSQGEEAWIVWKAGKFGGVSSAVNGGAINEGPMEAKTAVLKGIDGLLLSRG